jgi:hypothetical protein
MLNVRNIVVDAYKMIGDISDSESLDGTRSTIGLQLLNQLVTKLNLDNMFAFTMQNVTYQPIATQDTYSIGIPTVAQPTVDINAVRPSNIARLYARQSSNGSSAYEINQVGLQDLPMFSINSVGMPSYFAYKSTYPLAGIEFDSSLDTSYELIISYNTAIPTLNFNDVLEIPPEYEPALKYGLSVVLAKRYGKPREVIADMLSLRDETYNDIKSNTMVKTNIIHHLENSYGNANVLNRGGIY